MAEARPWSARLSGAIGLGKDLVALLRDAALFVLAALLVLFPARFNDILVDAGFEEGSVVGFKWKANLLESNEALQEAQATIATLQGRNEELLTVLNDPATRIGSPELQEQLGTLQRESAAIQSNAQAVQETVSQTIAANTPLVAKAAASAGAAAPPGKADYRVGVQTAGLDDSERLRLNGQLSAAGYGLDAVSGSYPANPRPAWFAARPTVFYSAASAQPAAAELARFLSATTGQAFAVQRGAGLGVDPAYRGVTLFVHYLRG